MKYLRSFNESFNKELTDEEFQIAFDYFCYEVFSKEKRDDIEECVKFGVEEVDFLEIVYNRWDDKKRLFGNYGIEQYTEGGYMSMSDNFASTINDETYNIQNVKTWKRLFKDALDWLKYQSWPSSDKSKHGWPYFRYSFDVRVISGNQTLTKPQIERMLSCSQSMESYNIIRPMSRAIESYAKVFYGMDIKASSTCYGERFNKGCSTIQITITDKDFKPKDIFSNVLSERIKNV